jgi:hypothetical protein
MQQTRLRAIPTRYKGYAFRSRLEARWAVFFDHLNIKWEYEPEGFDLGNGLRYLPDFWLPDLNLWVEVKPSFPDFVTLEKASRLVIQGGDPVFISFGMPAGGGTLLLKNDDGLGCVDRTEAEIDWAHLRGCLCAWTKDHLCSPETLAAYEVARCAHFDLGQRGVL